MTEPNILRYEWTHAGLPSETMVELSFAKELDEHRGRNVFLRIHVMPQKEREGDKLTAFEEFRFNALQKKVEKAAINTNSIIPGVRRYGNVLIFYCYCPDEDAAERIVLAAQKARWAIVDSEQKFDPSWSVYLHDLYPTPAQFQTVKNEEIIDLMLQYDEDMVSPRRVDHYCTFRDELSRICFEEDARKSGFALGEPYYAPDSDLPHGAVVRNLGAIEKRSIDEWTTKVISIVDKYQGSYNGWDTPMKRRKKTKVL